MIKNVFTIAGGRIIRFKYKVFRVELNEIEHTVRQYHSKGSNVVVAKTQSIRQSGSYIFFLEKYEGNDSNLFEYLKEKLPIYMCPKKIYEISELPLNTSGKVDRKKLLQLI